MMRGSKLLFYLQNSGSSVNRFYTFDILPSAYIFFICFYAHFWAFSPSRSLMLFKAP